MPVQRSTWELEVAEAQFGFIPNSQDTAAWRMCRRYCVHEGGLPQLWRLVHYSRVPPKGKSLHQYTPHSHQNYPSEGVVVDRRPGPPQLHDDESPGQITLFAQVRALELVPRLAPGLEAPYVITAFRWINLTLLRVVTNYGDKKLTTSHLLVY
ncbi:uncharacterized protein EDB93DRAFT_1338876 [Suillus bovinus]|uniref:uncharacterized protein n=1 Tax=Suillus bovinus TaxID=48563 RepID=UPI001B86DB9F|nr:uncharacterized protein EDB93DRAFT_1338876 [Suillus bovinus]KAG2139588.1 hypothetical protein EDB93DRAFT_1338876 [Suillus bovinus]